MVLKHLELFNKYHHKCPLEQKVYEKAQQMSITPKFGKNQSDKENPTFSKSSQKLGYDLITTSGFSIAIW